MIFRWQHTKQSPGSLLKIHDLFCKSELGSKKLHFQHGTWVTLMNCTLRKPGLEILIPGWEIFSWNCFPYHFNLHKDLILYFFLMCSCSNSTSNISMGNILSVWSNLWTSKQNKLSDSSKISSTHSLVWKSKMRKEILTYQRKRKLLSLCETVCDPMNYTVHGIFQVRILEWVSCSLLQGIFPT